MHKVNSEKGPGHLVIGQNGEMFKVGEDGKSYPIIGRRGEALENSRRFVERVNAESRELYGRPSFRDVIAESLGRAPLFRAFFRGA
jgi:hypothetical protein